MTKRLSAYFIFPRPAACGDFVLSGAALVSFGTFADLLV
jgi:hypothetical protein